MTADDDALARELAAEAVPEAPEAVAGEAAGSEGEQAG